MSRTPLLGRLFDKYAQGCDTLSSEVFATMWARRPS
jgi:hypothetical protein